MNSYIVAYLVLALYIVIMGIKRFKEKKLKIVIVTVLTIFFSLTVGARILWYIVNKPSNIEELFKLSLSNLKLSGGLFGAVLGLYILTKIFKEEKRNILNTVIEGLFFSAGVAKIGCFVTGCCIGKPTSMPWKVSYPEHGFYDLHPVQLYEALVWWIGFVLLIELKDKFKDLTKISVAVLFYVLMRMFILDELYVGGQFLGTPSIKYIYITAVIICVFCIIIDKKEIFKVWKKKIKK